MSETELTNYLAQRKKTIEKMRKDKIGEYDKNLAFDNLREKERTKHVHRLHPYKGKFIPQLVEYFLKRNFHEGHFILDPFMGSGTTLVQASEMGIDSLGIDISPFNCLISKVKTQDYNIELLSKEINKALTKTQLFSKKNFSDIEKKSNYLRNLRLEFNREIMPEIKEKTDDESDRKKISEAKFKTWLNEKKDDQLSGSTIKINVKRQEIKTPIEAIDSNYLKEWFAERSSQELLYYKSITSNYENKDVLKIILSRAARSSRLVPHYDLTNPSHPVNGPYYCYKHKQICSPIDNAISKLRRYSKDTIKRIKEYSELKKGTKSIIKQGDSTKIDLGDYKFNGVFTSPPYVGLINYHEQHRYAYELLDIERFDEKEIGPKSNGKSQEAKEEYVENISQVFINLRKYMKKNAKIFIVANDKDNLYGEIANRSGLEIIKEYKRPVSKRAERDRKPYSEKIFKMIYL